MTTVGSVIMLIGSVVGLLAGVGLLRFETTYARFHAAGKASPVAFLIVAFGAAFVLGSDGAAWLVVAAAAMVLTFPVGVHLLFRAVHRTTSSDHLLLDELRSASQKDRARHFDDPSD